MAACAYACIPYLESLYRKELVPESWAVLSQVFCALLHKSMDNANYFKCYWIAILLQMTVFFSPGRGYFCGTVINNDVPLSYYQIAGQASQYRAGTLPKSAAVNLTGPVKTAFQDDPVWGGTFCYAQVRVNGTNYWSKLHEQRCAFAGIPTSYNYDSCSDLECELRTLSQGLTVPFISNRDWFIFPKVCLD
jgi:hypothetical protein